MTTGDKLPKVPSELLELAITDAASLDRDRYTPQAHSYHKPLLTEQLCQVCLAGAIMAGTIGIKNNEDLTPLELFQNGRITKNDMKALTAVDNARAGAWHVFLHILYIRPENTPNYDQLQQELKEQPNLHDHFQNWEQFDEHVKHIRNCTRILKSHGC